MQWYSNIDGVIGDGSGSFSTDGLSEGFHTITLTATENGQTEKSAPVYVTIYDRQKNLGYGNNDGEKCLGDPINILTGNEIQSETDFSTRTETPLYLHRVYNSYSADKGLFGYGWISNFDQKLKFIAGANQAYVIDETGAGQRFTLANGKWIDSSSSRGTLVLNADNSWTYTMYDGTVKNYNASGQITHIHYHNNQYVSFSYVNGKLDTVTDSFGHSVSFTYNAVGYVETVTTPDHFVYTYKYSNDNLQYVYYPDSTPTDLSNNPKKQYMYEDVRFPHAITGIVDEENKRFATIAYDEYGRAVHSDHAGTELEDVSYNADGTVSDTIWGDVQSNGSRSSRTTIYKFTSIKGLLKVTDVSGDESARCASTYTHTEYDPTTGFIESQTDRNQNKTTYTTNAFGQVESQIVNDVGKGWAANGAAITYETDTKYNAQQLPWQITTPGLFEERLYTTENRIKSITKTDKTSVNYGDQRAWIYHYDFYTDPNTNASTGVVKTITIDGPRTDNDVVTEQYNANGYLTSVTNGKGQEVKYQDYTADGLPQTEFNQNNVKTTYVYNERGWLRFKHVYLATGVVTTEYQYYLNGLLHVIKYPNGTSLTYEYDDARHLTAIQNSAGDKESFTPGTINGKWREKDIYAATGAKTFTASRVFDELGRIVNDMGANGQQSSYVYDLNGNLAKTTTDQSYDGVNGQESNEITDTRFYDALNHVRIETASDKAPVFFGYDAAGNLSQVLVGASLSTSPPITSQYGDKGQLQAAAPAASASSFYQFDSLGHIVPGGSATPPGQLTTYVYNGFGEKVEQDSPATGKTTYHYDAKTGQTVITRNDGTTETISTDVLGRVTNIAYSASSADNVTYTYDTALNGIGKLATVQNASEAQSYAYTDFGAVDYMDYTVAGHSFKLDYNYDNYGQLSNIVYPTGRTVTYLRDSLGRVNGITAQGSPQGDVTLVSNVTYEPFGPMASIVYGNGLSQVSGFDTSYRQIQIQNDWLTSKETINLKYDTADRLRDEEQLSDSSGQNTVFSAKQYDYDLADRLKAARWYISGQQSVDPNLNAIEYDYNDYGDRIARRRYDATANVAGNEIENTTYAINQNNNQIDSIADVDAVGNKSTNKSYGYTTLGETHSDGDFIYGYNQAQRLDNVTQNGQTVASYQYNANGERVSKTVGSTTTVFHYDLAGNLLAETDANGNLIREYAYLNGAPIAMFGGDLLYTGFESTPDKLIDTETTRIVAPLGGESSNFTGLKGDGEISSNLISGGGTTGDTYVGLSIREDADNPNSAGVTVKVSSYNQFVPIMNGGILIPIFVLQNQSIDIDVTDESGNTTTEQLAFSGSSMIKLVRDGQYVEVMTSADGQTWTMQRQYNMPMPDSVVLGVVSSNTNTNVTLNRSINNDNVFYIYPDHLGSPYALSNDAKNKVWSRHTFDKGASPFGEDLTFTGKQYGDGLFDMPLRFPGQYSDTETGHSYNFHRDYDPATGRYVQSDPMGISAGDNTYVYANGDPTGLVDILGLQCLPQNQYGLSEWVDPVDKEFQKNLEADDSKVKSFLWGMAFPFFSEGAVLEEANVVYRGLAEGEDPALGLFARAPGAGDSEVSHVAGKKLTQWISTTKSKVIALKKYGENGVVKIDLNKVDSVVSDVSEGFAGKSRLSNYAQKDREVLIKDYIPPHAISPLE